ncbi:hypothetical protein K438DRAFT_1980226 [Mycena galopus ATCC 62051]|nr:hypothetical protein K438DRAFT_1980226 [Mycena galopus ATCC 62051]
MDLDQIKVFTSLIQSGAVASALFSATSAQLLTAIKSDGPLSSPGLTALLYLSYGAMIFNALATAASQSLVTQLGGIRFGGEDEQPITAGGHPVGFLSSIVPLLRRSDAWTTIKWVAIQWVTYFALGIAFAVAQCIADLRLYGTTHGLSAIVPLLVVPIGLILAVTTCYDS